MAKGSGGSGRGGGVSGGVRLQGSMARGASDDQLLARRASLAERVNAIREMIVGTRAAPAGVSTARLIASGESARQQIAAIDARRAARRSAQPKWQRQEKALARMRQQEARLTSSANNMYAMRELADLRQRIRRAEARLGR